MRCDQCGEGVPEGAQFCGQCGARISAPSQASPVSPISAASSRPPASLVGQVIAGRYRLIRQIGEGGSGSVYEAEQALGDSRRSVAVKLLTEEASHDPATKARFHREAATIAKLSHENTVRLYDFGETETGTLFLVMEYLEGRSLAQVLEQQGPLPPERMLRIANQVAASLEEAHGLGIVHRDVKPDNILLLDSRASREDVIKLVDFGIAKGEPAQGSSQTKVTALGSFVGTPAYMSPELFRGQPATARSDLYALGVTLYQLASNQLPFNANTVVEWARAHMSTPPPPLAADYGAGALPEHMRRAVLRALSKAPDERQISAGQFAAELSGRGATFQTQAAPEIVLTATAGPGGHPRASGGLKTSPMTQLPELGEAAGGGRAGALTVPMAARAAAPRRPLAAYAEGAAPMEPPPRTQGRRWIWALVALAASLGLALVVIGVSGVQIGPLRIGSNAEEAPPPLAGAPEEPLGAPATPTEPEAAGPEPTAQPEPPRAPAPPPVSAPPGATPTPQTPAPQSPAPQAPLPAPTPPAQGAPPAPLPAPGAAPPGLPQLPPLPWQLPTAGACQRCLEAVRGSGNYSVVTAVGESLLCEDRAARELCEREIQSVAPEVAERAARAGDCPAALATAAAAVKVNVPADRFRTVEALCLR